MLYKEIIKIIKELEDTSIKMKNISLLLRDVLEKSRDDLK